MKKKVFFIMSTDDYSGAEAVNFSIIDGLKDKYDFTWVSRKGKINKFLEENNIKWIEIKKLSVSEIKRVIKEYKPDILHATDFTASVISSFASKNTPIISHLHHNATWLRTINLKTLIYSKASSKFSQILTVSDSIKNEFVFSKHIESKIICIGNPVSRNTILNKIEKNIPKEYDICCLGRLTEAKNPLRFIKIVEKLAFKNPKIKAIWIGDGELRKQFEKKVKEKQLDENILMIGFKSNPYNYLARAKVFLLASKWEGFGLAAFEAITVGLPCVVSNVGGLPSIVDDSCGKLCNNDNDFIKELEKLLNEDEYYKMKSFNAVLKSKKIENMSSYLDKINEIYSKF